MAVGKKTGGRNFEKGNQHGKGRPKYTAEQLEIKNKLEKIDGKLIIAKYCITSQDELEEKLLDKSLPCIDRMIMSVINRCINRAELHILIWIYEKLGWQEKEDYGQDQKIFNLAYGINRNKKEFESEEN